MSNESPEEVAVRIGIALTDETASDYGSGKPTRNIPKSFGLYMACQIPTRSSPKSDL